MMQRPKPPAAVRTAFVMRRRSQCSSFWGVVFFLWLGHDLFRGLSAATTHFSEEEAELGAIAAAISGREYVRALSLIDGALMGQTKKVRSLASLRDNIRIYDQSNMANSRDHGQVHAQKQKTALISE